MRNLTELRRASLVIEDLITLGVIKPNMTDSCMSKDDMVVKINVGDIKYNKLRKVNFIKEVFRQEFYDYVQISEVDQYIIINILMYRKYQDDIKE